MFLETAQVFISTSPKKEGQNMIDSFSPHWSDAPKNPQTAFPLNKEDRKN
jgi:hypothetical protein